MGSSWVRVAPRVSTFGMAYSPVVSFFLMAAFPGGRSSGGSGACETSSCSTLILVSRSARWNQAEMPGQSPCDSRRDDKSKARHQHHRADHEQSPAAFGNAMTE